FSIITGYVIIKFPKCFMEGYILLGLLITFMEGYILLGLLITFYNLILFPLRISLPFSYKIYLD
ncbi:hypothetical protein DXA68_18110, partial [Bacteroides stercorirosoris]